MAVRMDFQSEAFSPRRMQMPSRAILTTGGGLPMERISTRSFFLIPFTAAWGPRAIQNVLTSCQVFCVILPTYLSCLCHNACLPVFEGTRCNGSERPVAWREGQREETVHRALLERICLENTCQEITSSSVMLPFWLCAANARPCNSILTALPLTPHKVK